MPSMASAFCLRYPLDSGAEAETFNLLSPIELMAEVAVRQQETRSRFKNHNLEILVTRCVVKLTLSHLSALIYVLVLGHLGGVRGGAFHRLLRLICR